MSDSEDRGERASAVACRIVTRVAAVTDPAVWSVDGFFDAIAEDASATVEALLRWERNGSPEDELAVRQAADRLVAAAQEYNRLPVRRHQSGNPEMEVHNGNV
jgi:hypothetical protein